MDDILSSPSSDVFLKKATITLAAVFFLTSLILAVRTSHQSVKSILEKKAFPVNAVPAGQQQSVPAVPPPVVDEQPVPENIE